MGTLPAGGSFCSVKRNQNPLRAFPPKDLPGVLVGTCAFLSSALDGSGHIDGVDILWVVPALCIMVLLFPGPSPGEPLFPAVGGLAAQFWWAGRKKALNIAKFLGLMGVGEGLAPPESPRAMPGNQRAGQATAPTTATQEVRQTLPAAVIRSRTSGGGNAASPG